LINVAYYTYIIALHGDHPLFEKTKNPRPSQGRRLRLRGTTPIQRRAKPTTLDAR
jgi:hypothetical protein